MKTNDKFVPILSSFQRVPPRVDSVLLLLFDRRYGGRKTIMEGGKSRSASWKMVPWAFPPTCHTTQSRSREKYKKLTGEEGKAYMASN